MVDKNEPISKTLEIMYRACKTTDKESAPLYRAAAAMSIAESIEKLVSISVPILAHLAAEVQKQVKARKL